MRAPTFHVEPTRKLTRCTYNIVFAVCQQQYSTSKGTCAVFMSGMIYKTSIRTGSTDRLDAVAHVVHEATIFHG